MAQPATTRWCLVPWQRRIAVLLAVASLSLSLASRRFHCPARDGISTQVYSSKFPNQRLADDGHHWVLPVVIPVLCPSHPTRSMLPRPAPIIFERSESTLYDRPPPAA